MSPDILSPARLIYYRLFQLQVKFRCYWADHFGRTVADGLEMPPAALRFRVSESCSIENFSRIGRRCAQLVGDQIRASRLELTSDDPVLDFGCGCARTARWILAEFPNLKLHGVDVDPEAIAWCRAHHPSSSFLVNRPLPPLPYPDGYFRVVYCISVFTHLNEHDQDLWLAELRRIIQPGGLLIITVHGRNASSALSAKDRAVLAATGFVHKTSTKMRGLVPEGYHTTWHTRDYILTRISAWCKETSYVEIKDGLQDVVAGIRAI